MSPAEARAGEAGGSSQGTSLNDPSRLTRTPHLSYPPATGLQGTGLLLPQH